MRFPFSSLKYSRGFTLIEAIVVIVITGIVAGMVAVFIRSPVEGYVAAQRRSELSDAADTAMRRMARDFRLALPNSIRTAGNASDQCLEFIPTKIGARYRAVVDGATGDGNVLDFTTTDDAFDMLWPNAAGLTPLPAASRIAAGDVIVVYNDGSATGSAYSGANAIQVAAVAEPGGTPNTTAITFVTAAQAAPFNRKQFPSESPFGRFQVIPAGSHVVSYRCDGGTLTRNVRVLSGAWARPATCTAMVAGAVTSSTLATNVGVCSLTYDPPGVSTALSRFGIVSISLGMTAQGETVNIYDQIHVDNTP